MARFFSTLRQKARASDDRLVAGRKSRGSFLVRRHLRTGGSFAQHDDRLATPLPRDEPLSSRLRILVAGFDLRLVHRDWAVGFFYRVLTVAYSDEHRSALLKQATDAHSEKIAKRESIPPALPSLQPFTDSPGVRLAYRLPGNRPETQELVLGSFFVLAWNALTVFLGVYAIGRLVQWQPDWVLMLVGIPFFVYVAVRATRWFLISFLRSTRMGSTTIEIDDLPLVVGEGYRLSLVQYGRLAVKKISIALVCEEVATYHFGTDTRTERQEVYRQAVLEQGRCRIDWGRPLELACEFRLPTHAMHSFQSPHNAIAWKFVVEGEANRWPSYCRSFPVVVYPPARNEKRRAVAS